MIQDRTGIVKIRPKVLFQAIEQRFPEQNNSFKVNIPTSEIGGMTLLESSILVSLIKLFDCRSLFEFGTFMGATTLLLAENSSVDATVTTVDIPADGARVGTGFDASKILQDGDSNDDYLRERFSNQGARCMARADKAAQAKVTQILQDSTTLDVSKQDLVGCFDFVFVDGGHDYLTVAKDTENAYRMVRKNAVLVWHDFESNIHADVTRFLTQHCRDRLIFHVEHTMLAFELIGDYADLLDVPR